uniref:Single-stranded DNA-binding protein n=1 Tax=Candidatus Kentrum sp. SD TaxID=2126332 RepID=A0A450YDN9_9GAMM|nr:MAG: single-strand DNA-binding protein [Candidatus Kentron sp. SD]VFK47145.1 MAG: single-strand DNA-binding protein [Candidatus Kentron sp. SD]VFK81154.1 MAG: single-strand DNA-binding protein [Candidatus Kentron sp. SD]
MNTITLYGHLGQDVEQKVLESGQRLINLRLATNIRKGGNDETLWWRVTAWGDRFKNLEPYLKKGTALIIVGTMQPPRTFQDQEGKSQVSLDVTAHNISFSPFGGKSDETQDSQGSQEPTTAKQPQQGQAKATSYDEKHAFKDDEIPF